MLYESQLQPEELAELSMVHEWYLVDFQAEADEAWVFIVRNL